MAYNRGLWKPVLQVDEQGPERGPLLAGIFAFDLLCMPAVSFVTASCRKAGTSVSFSGITMWATIERFCSPTVR